MFAIASRGIQRIIQLLQRFVVVAWSSVTRLLTRQYSHSRDVGQHDALPEYSLPPSTPIQYIPVPGSWAREKHPQWSESVFQIPEHVGPGEIYYISKGTFVSMGTHAIIERSPAGHIVKSPKMNPYNRAEERRDRETVAREGAIYQLIGPSPFVPRLVSWDEKSYTLTIEGPANKDLKTYSRDNGSHISANVHRKWAWEAAKALETVHAVGVTHHDVAPRNFVLDERLNLRICDFGGSSYPGVTVSLCAPGPRYQSRPWFGGYVPSKADDVFGLGSVLYFIVVGEEPHQDLEDEEVERLFGLQRFPETRTLRYGRIIHACWTGQLTTAQEVAVALDRLIIDSNATGSATLVSIS